MSLLAASLIASAVTAALLLGRHRIVAALAALVAGGALVLASARLARSGPRRERFALLVCDRLFDAAALAPIAWAARDVSIRTSALALVVLGASFVASYERARGESLGYRGNEGLEYRTARLALIALTLLTGWLELGLWLLTVLVVAALAVRAVNVARQDRRDLPAALADR